MRFIKFYIKLLAVICLFIAGIILGISVLAYLIDWMQTAFNMDSKFATGLVFSILSILACSFLFARMMYDEDDFAKFRIFKLNNQMKTNMAGGRPTKFKEEYIEQVKKLCKLGATDAVIADFFNVTETTVNNWKKTNPEFFESLKRGKLDADMEIAESMFLSAKGYERSEIRFNDEGEAYEVERHYPANATLAIFWMKNRQPALWRDKTETVVEVESSGFDINIINAKKS